MEINVTKIKKELRAAIKPGKAEVLQYFFKTGPGQYGEHDKFLGVMVPEQRIIAKANREAKLEVLEKLLASPWHEERLTAALILVDKFGHANESERKKLFNFYLKNKAAFNNWDLVDLSTPHVLGAWWFENFDQAAIDKLANSASLWDRRMAMLASFYFIKNKSYSLTLELTTKFLNDKEDLMHKASGWMLREIGKRDEKTLKKFLDKYYRCMPRTMLRYAIERLSEQDKKHYMIK